MDAITELVDTELTYITRLAIVYEIFKQNAEAVLTVQERRTLFGNIEEILLANQQFYAALASMDNAEEQLPAVLVDFMTNRFVCYAEYCCNHRAACEMLKERDASPAFQDFIAACMQQSAASTKQGLDLASFLLEPVQRISRYPLIIKQIVHTSDNKQAYLQALQASQTLLDTVNAAVGEHENQERAKELDMLLEWTDYKVNLTEPTAWGEKRLLLVPNISCVDSIGRQRQAHLFSDFLLVTDALLNRVVGLPWPIEQVDFDGSSLVMGSECATLTDPADELLRVAIRAALDTAQHSFYSSLDKKPAVEDRSPGTYAGILEVVVKSASSLYTLPSRYARLPCPFLRLSMFASSATGAPYQIYESAAGASSTEPEFNFALDILVRSPADSLLLQVLDKRPFAPPLPLGRYCMPIGDLADYFVGVQSTQTVPLEGVPRGSLQFSVVYKLL